MKAKPQTQMPDDECNCGHSFSEHVQTGGVHGCQHNCKPPYTNECPCSRFKLKKKP